MEVNITHYLQHGDFPKSSKNLVVAIDNRLLPSSRRLRRLDIELGRRRLIVVALGRLELVVVRHLSLVVLPSRPTQRATKLRRALVLCDGVQWK